MVVRCPPVDSPAYKYYEQTEEILGLAERLLGSKESALSWFTTKTDYFFGDSPQDAVYKNEYELVVNLLRERLGEIDGQAF